MKKLNIVLLFVFLLVSCTSAEVVPTAAVTPEFTNTPAPTQTETPSPTLTPNATLMPLDIECIIEDNISTQEDCRLLLDAIELGRHYLLDHFGRDATGALKIRLYNDPNNVTGGYLNEGKSLALNTKDLSNINISINTAHRDWKDYGGEEFMYKRKIGAIHEFTHYWQLKNGCMKTRTDTTDFMLQGHASYVSFMTTGRLELFNPGQAIVDWPHWNYDEIVWFDAGDVSPLVFKGLIDHFTPSDFMNYCDLISNGAAPKDAFYGVYGQTVEDFRTQFKAEILGSQKDCTQATCGTSFGKEDPRYGSLTPMIDYSLKDPNLIIKIIDKDGNPVPDVNLQLFRKLFNNFYLGTGGEDNGTNAAGTLSAPVLPGTYGMTFCEAGYLVGMYSGDVDKCVYELNPFEVVPGEIKTVNFQYWDIQDHSLPKPNFVFTLLNVDGQPSVNQYVQVCGYDAISTVCLNGKTDEVGVFHASLNKGNYEIRLVQPGQGFMGPRGYSNPRYGLNLNPYHQTKRFEYEIRDIKIENSKITALTHQFPAPNLKIQFLDANGSAIPSIHFDLCKSETKSGATPEEMAATDKMLSAYIPDWPTKKIKAGDLNGDCFLKDHTDDHGVFQIRVDPGSYFIYYDNPGSFVFEFYFDHVVTDVIVGEKDVTTILAEFK